MPDAHDNVLAGHDVVDDDLSVRYCREEAAGVSLQAPAARFRLGVIDMSSAAISLITSSFLSRAPREVTTHYFFTTFPAHVYLLYYRDWSRPEQRR